MKILVIISRLIVGSLFIVSGLIKANDALGFSYKLEEYFGADVLNMEFLIPYALPIAMIICIVEVVLGIAAIFGSKSKLVSWSLLLMMLFFTFLTFYSWKFNKVTDCGCFGDALKLTPFESFIKDVILTVFTAFIFAYRNKIKMNTVPEDRKMIIASMVLIILFSGFVIGWWLPVFFALGLFIVTAILKQLSSHKHLDWIIAIIATIVTTGYTMHCFLHLPVKDFRPYKIGANILEDMSYPEDAQQPVFEYTWYFDENGTEKAYKTKGSYPKSTGKFLRYETEEIIAGYEPPIHDFTMEIDGGDYTEDLMNEAKLVLICAYDINKSDDDGWKIIKEKTDEALQKGYKVVGLCSSESTVSKAFAKQNALNFEFYYCDGTAIKTIVRSNPGILVLEKGTITQKAHHNDAEDIQL